MGQEIYDAIGDRLEAAFLAFRRQHELMHTLPIKPARTSRRDWMMRAMLFLVVIAGFVVSGSRTIVIFAIGKTIVIGGASVVMLEGAAIVMSFYHTREKYREQEVQRGYMARYLRIGSLFAVIVMCAGNTQDVLQIDGFATGNLWTALSLPIALSVALSAPIMVFIAGHVLALLSVLDMVQDRKAEQDFEEKLRTWNDDMLRSWQTQKRRYGAVVDVQVEHPSNEQLTTPPVHSVNSLNAANERSEPDVQRSYSVNSSAGYSKRMDAKQVIREFFERNPQRVNEQLDGLVKSIEQESGVKVGRTSVHNVRQDMRGGK